MGVIHSISVTLERADDAGNVFETTAFINAESWSQSGGSTTEAGESRDLISDLFDAAAPHLDRDDDEDCDED